MILPQAGRPAGDPPDDQRSRGPRGSPPALGRPGRCPLYVRAQLDSAGLSWTQRDLVRPEAAAREPQYAQVTGCFRWWWQVQGSNLRRLSRRFYRPFPRVHRNGRRPGHTSLTIM